MTTPVSQMSPGLNFKGSVSRTETGFVTGSSVSEIAKLSFSTPTAVILYEVRLSGRMNFTSAMPFSSVINSGSKSAVGSKFFRSCNSSSFANAASFASPPKRFLTS